MVHSRYNVAADLSLCSGEKAGVIACMTQLNILEKINSVEFYVLLYDGFKCSMGIPIDIQRPVAIPCPAAATGNFLAVRAVYKHRNYAPAYG